MNNPDYQKERRKQRRARSSFRPVRIASSATNTIRIVLNGTISRAKPLATRG
jgi:hypothetical protein